MKAFFIFWNHSLPLSEQVQNRDMIFFIILKSPRLLCWDFVFLKLLIIKQNCRFTAVMVPWFPQKSFFLLLFFGVFFYKARTENLSIFKCSPCMMAQLLLLGLIISVLGKTHSYCRKANFPRNQNTKCSEQNNWRIRVPLESEIFHLTEPWQMWVGV